MNKLKTLLREKNISQIELAKKLEITDASVSKWIKWGVSIPYKHKLKICKILDCSTSDLEEGGDK